MVALTYGDTRVGNIDSAPAAEAKPVAAIAPRKAWYVRLFDAMIEARMQQARREINIYARMTPYMIDESGNHKHKLKTETNEPAGGW